MTTTDSERATPTGTARRRTTPTQLPSQTHPAVSALGRYRSGPSRTVDGRPAPEVEDWKGTVEPTVDRTKHVNGGCRSLVSDGTVWQCYLGPEAVRQQIVSDGFLGQQVEGPGRG